MRKRLFFLILCIAGLLFDAMAQSGFLEGKDAYLGQKPPGDQPEVFAEDLLMKSDTFPMGRVAFSKDGKEFYYTSSNTWFNNKPTKIRYFKYENSKWNGPFVLNEHWGQYVSSEGKYLFYSTGHSPKDCRIVWVRFDRLLVKLKAQSPI